MRDCKLIVTVRDDKVNFEGQDISVEELAQIAGFLQVFVGMEDEPERGGRCLQCFTLRLSETARYAAEHGFTLFTTTLASSRWKSLDQINLAGRRAAALYPGTIFWEQNWRKGGLQDRRNQLLKEHDFYNQQYCGCEFSMRRLEEKE